MCPKASATFSLYESIWKYLLSLFLNFWLFSVETKISCEAVRIKYLSLSMWSGLYLFCRRLTGDVRCLVCPVHGNGLRAHLGPAHEMSKSTAPKEAREFPQQTHFPPWRWVSGNRSNFKKRMARQVHVRKWFCIWRCNVNVIYLNRVSTFGDNYEVVRGLYVFFTLLQLYWPLCFYITLHYISFIPNYIK